MAESGLTASERAGWKSGRLPAEGVAFRSRPKPDSSEAGLISRVWRLSHMLREV